LNSGKLLPNYFDGVHTFHIFKIIAHKGNHSLKKDGALKYLVSDYLSDN